METVNVKLTNSSEAHTEPSLIKEYGNFYNQSSTQNITILQNVQTMQSSGINAVITPESVSKTPSNAPPTAYVNSTKLTMITSTQSLRLDNLTQTITSTSTNQRSKSTLISNKETPIIITDMFSVPKTRQPYASSTPILSSEKSLLTVTQSKVSVSTTKERRTTLTSSTITSKEQSKVSTLTTNLSTVKSITANTPIKPVPSKSSTDASYSTYLPKNTQSTTKSFSTRRKVSTNQKQELTSKRTKSRKSQESVIKTMLTSSTITHMKTTTPFIPNIFTTQKVMQPMKDISAPRNTTSASQGATLGATALVLVVILPFLTLFLIAIIIVLKKKCKKKSSKRKRYTKEDVEMDTKDKSQRERLTKPSDDA